jgi:transcriptional regulator
MYLPAHFEQGDTAQLHGLMRAHPLATLVTQGPDGLTADHLPLEFVAACGAADRAGVAAGLRAEGGAAAAALAALVDAAGDPR